MEEGNKEYAEERRYTPLTPEEKFRQRRRETLKTIVNAGLIVGGTVALGTAGVLWTAGVFDRILGKNLKYVDIEMNNGNTLNYRCYPLDEVMTSPYRYIDERVCLEGFTESADYRINPNTLDQFFVFLRKNSDEPFFLFSGYVQREDKETAKKLRELVEVVDKCRKTGNYSLKIKVAGYVRKKNEFDSGSFKLDSIKVDNDWINFSKE